MLYCELVVPSLVCIMLQAGQRRKRREETIEMKKINPKPHLTLQQALLTVVFTEALNGSPLIIQLKIYLEIIF